MDGGTTGRAEASALPPRVRLLIVENDRIALIRRVRAGRTYYVLPGGGVEPGETFEEAGIREAYEELGVHVALDRLRYDESFGGQRFRYYDARITSGTFGTGEWPDHADRTPEGREAFGTYEAQWVALDSLQELDLGVPIDALLDDRPVIRMDHIEHAVITVADLERTRQFYSRVLGLQTGTSNDGQTVLHLGAERLVIEVGGPAVGHATVCLVSAVRLKDLLEHLTREGVPLEAGPMRRRGGLGERDSIFLRDPDGNRVEICSYD